MAREAKHRLIFGIVFLLLSTASAFSKDKRIAPWGLFKRHEGSTSEKSDHTINEPKRFELDTSLSSTMEISIDQNVRRVAETAAHKEGAHRPLRLILMGGPAAGKGTQCRRIASQYGVIHLSTGDMLREVVARDSESGVGAVLKVYMDAGELVPDEIIIQIVTDRISQRDCQQQGWLLDGFPRTHAQAEALANAGTSADCFILLNVADEVLVERVVGRRLDPDTGKIYHIEHFPPPEEAQQRLVQRSDDTVEKITNRLMQFHRNIGAVRSFYDSLLVEVDGTGSPEMISQRIMEGINSKLVGRKSVVEKETLCSAM